MGGDERASLLQPRGACVCVEDLGYAREVKGGMSMELSGVNFVAQPGEVWFCMGRSGPWMRGARVDNERRVRGETDACL